MAGLFCFRVSMGSFGVATITLFVCLGSFAGFLAGLLGIGGGIILVPLFLWAFNVSGFSPEIIVHTAFGTSLSIIIPTAFSSTLGHRKRGNVDWHQVSYLCMGGIFGALCGAWFASLLSGEWLRGFFGIMQILVAAKLFIFHPRLPPVDTDRVSPWALLLVGLTGGTFSAFFGVGGGVIAVPMMVIFLSLPIHLAVGNSSALIVFSSLSGATSYMLHGLDSASLPPFSIGYVNFLVFILVAPFTICMARIGVRVASRTPHDKLVRIFAVLLVFVGLRMIYKAWFN